MIKSPETTREWCLKQVKPGWACLINYFYTEAEKAPFNVFIDQIKEKFGGIRIYTTITGATEKQADDMYNLTDALLEASILICEECGKKGEQLSPPPHGWVKTLCSEHARPGDVSVAHLFKWPV